jgi:hypothetical protein
MTILAAGWRPGVLVVGLGAWLGQVWADRIKGTDRARFSRELEKLRNDLEIARVQHQRISDARFPLYSQVWIHLQDLKLIEINFVNKSQLKDYRPDKVH